MLMEQIYLLTTQTLTPVLLFYLVYSIKGVSERVRKIEELLNIPVSILGNGKDVVLTQKKDEELHDLASNLLNEGSPISSTKKLEGQSL